MKKLKILSVIFIIALFTSCTVTYPGLVTKNPVGKKVGTASRTIYLGIKFGHTDLSLTTAAKNGKITKIATVDYTVTGGIISKTHTVTVTGE